VIEAHVEARWQARLEREEDAKSAAAAAERPVGGDVTQCVLVNGGMQIEAEMGVRGLWRKLHGWMKADA
jgi:hypothetical protein